MELALRLRARDNDFGVERAVKVATAPLLLHVDDDEDVAFLLRRALRSKGVAHWSFLHQSSGSEALDYLRRARSGGAPLPTLLVLDVKMPGMGGLDVLEWVRATMPELPAVMLSSSGLPQERLRARELGSRGYFEKSATFSEVVEFLRDWEAARSFSQSADLARCISWAA